MSSTDKQSSERVQMAQSKAHVLAEALPWMTTWNKKTVVIKIGGNAIADAKEQVAVKMAEDVAMMHSLGLRVVVVHGAGPQISELAQIKGVKPHFREGLRVTDEAMMDIVETVITGQVNPALVRLISAQGVPAVGVSGVDTGGFLRATLKEGYGRTGNISQVDTELLETLLEARMVPVISPISLAQDGLAVNVNADSAAGAIAAAIGADKFIVLTNVEGLYKDYGTDQQRLISQLTLDELDELISTGEIVSGMVPKLAAIQQAVRDGVPQGHMLDGRLSHALLVEIFTDDGIGTMVIKGEKND